MNIQTALLTVSDKEGVVELARQLREAGIQILSTGGTALTLKEGGLPVTVISDYTGFPEILDGRVKTLHPKIHGGILARHDNSEHQRVLQENQIPPIGLVVVNLYPFAQTVRKKGVTVAEAIEQIDIGGPTLIRAAAKNHAYCTVVVDPADYQIVMAEIKANEGETGEDLRRWLARKAFHHTADYDSAISGYFEIIEEQKEKGLPTILDSSLVRIKELRYGENPHQRAALYHPRLSRTSGLMAARQYQGKELSYNNYLDLAAAWDLCMEFNEAACAIIKHNNPCGAATGKFLAQAYERAHSCDPVSAFGSVVGFNRKVDGATAEKMNTHFVEVVIAPAFDKKALSLFAKKKNLRVMEMSEEARSGSTWEEQFLDLRMISGGMLVQDKDRYCVAKEDLKTVTKREPTENEIEDLLFAWSVCKHVKSNAIVYVKSRQTIGIGAGQMSRVDSARLGTQKAQVELSECVMASDGFFPFRDSIDEVAGVGVKAIIQPGGSIRDEEVIRAANEHGIAMVFTEIRHFKH